MTHTTTIPEYNAEVVWDSAKTHTAVSLIINVPHYLGPEELSDILPYAAYHCDVELGDDTGIGDVAEMASQFVGTDYVTSYRDLLMADIADQSEHDRLCAAADAVVRRLFGLTEDPA